MGTMTIPLSPLGTAPLRSLPLAFQMPQLRERPLRATLPVPLRKDTVLRTRTDAVPPTARDHEVLPGAAAVDPAKAAEQEALRRLAAQCLSGDPAAWQQLVSLQHRRIYGICYRFTGSPSDAEDLTQEVFLKLYRALGSFDPAKGGLQTWITHTHAQLAGGSLPAHPW